MKRAPDTRPNILFILTDMQRADTIRALGNSVIRTPHLDRLVREGTAFTNCFSPSPVCVPARCCLQYGQYPSKTGLAENGKMMADNGNAYPAVLGRSGYRTHGVGKCHFTPEKEELRGFGSRQSQEEVTADPATDDYIAWLKENDFDYYEAHGARGEMYYIPQVSSLPAEAHPTQWIGDQSIRFMKEAAEGEQQWMLYSSFIHPHPPFAAPKPWHKLYRTSEMPLPFLPEGAEQLHTWINRLQNRYKYRDRGLDLNLIRTIIAYYYATISFVDFQVGRMLDCLESSGQFDNTLIVFSSDHGEMLGDFGCFGKRSMHDASSRVPLIVRQPGRFPAGKVCSTAVSLIDLLPTFAAAAGGDVSGLDLDGEDLAPIANRADGERTVFSQHGKAGGGIYMAVNRSHKYVFSAGDEREFFFDRAADPQEIDNRAEHQEPPMVALRQSLLEHYHSRGCGEAVVEENGVLGWKPYGPIDESYLAEPDARLIRQDYPSYPTDLPGYLE